jgi:hypothetical protein
MDSKHKPRKTRLFDVQSSPAKSIRPEKDSMVSFEKKFQVLNTDARSADFFSAQNVVMSRQYSSDNEMSHESQGTGSRGQNPDRDVIRSK